MLDPQHVSLREAAERRRQLRGLLLLAIGAIAFILLRYGPGQLLTPGWWRLW